MDCRKFVDDVIHDGEGAATPCKQFEALEGYTSNHFVHGRLPSTYFTSSVEKGSSLEHHVLCDSRQTNMGFATMRHTRVRQA